MGTSHGNKRTYTAFAVAGLAIVAWVLLSAGSANAAKPKLSIADAQAGEGEGVTFVVKLSKVSKEKVSAAYTVNPGTATTSDYVAGDGKVTIKKGKRQAQIAVQSTEDSADEPDEEFTVELSKIKNAKLGRDSATGTILDDDVPACTDGDGDGVCVEDSPPDCNDQESTIAPGLAEVLGDFVDNDCNAGTPDGADTADHDGDGFTIDAGDCNDTKTFIHPGATEQSNRIDDDCDGLVDEGN